MNHFNPFFVGFLPDACLSNIVEFEHAANLHTVEFVIPAYQHFFHQIYYDIGPFAIWLLTRPPQQARHQREGLALGRRGQLQYRQSRRRSTRNFNNEPQQS